MFDTPDLMPTPTEPLDAMIKSVEACAQRYHDPSPASMRRVAFAPTTPPWSLEPEELKDHRRGRAPHGAAPARPSVGNHGYVDYCLSAYRQAAGALDRRPRLARPGRVVRASRSYRRRGNPPPRRDRHRHGALPAIELPARLRHRAGRDDGGARRRGLARGRRRGIERIRRHDQRDEQRLAHPSRRQGRRRRDHRGRRALGERQRRPGARLRRRSA